MQTPSGFVAHQFQMTVESPLIACITLVWFQEMRRGDRLLIREDVRKYRGTISRKKRRGSGVAWKAFKGKRSTT